MANKEDPKKKSIDTMLQDAAIEKFGLKGVMEKIDKVTPLLEQVAAGAEVLKGADGKTPELGKDYLTEEEQQRALELVRPVKGRDYNDGDPGKDGYTPVRGLDYMTDDDAADFVSRVTPKKGTDYFTPQDVAEFKTAVTPIKGKDYNDGANPTAAQFLEVIKGLKGTDAASFSQIVGSKIDISHVRNAGSFIFNGKAYKTEELMHGGGSSGGSGTVTSIATSNGITGGTITTTGTIQLAANIRPIATLGSAGQLIRVNAGATALEYFTSSGGGVTSVVGTSNRITVDSTDPANPIVDISASYVGQSSITTLGTVTTGTWSATTIAVAKGGTGVTTIAAKSIWLANSADTITSVTPGAGQSIRINAGNTAWEAYTPVAGTVTSVSGTANRISSTGGATPVIDIDAAYVGQSSITTLGTIGTGTWNATTIAVNHGGTGGTSASITLFNNITGYTASGATGTTSTNLVFSTSPTLVTPTLGAATATSINRMAITAPVTSSTLAVADGKTFTVSNTLTFTGTDTNSFAFPSGSDTVVTLAASQTLTSKTLTSPTIQTSPVIAAATNIKLTVPSSDGTATGEITNEFNSGYSSTAVGDLVYLDSSATWQKADADASAATYSGFLGMALAVVASGNPVAVLLRGFIYAATPFPTFTIGSPVYMSATAGAVTQTAPVTTDSATRVIGYAIHADKMWFNPSNDYITHV